MQVRKAAPEEATAVTVEADELDDQALMDKVLNETEPTLPLPPQQTVADQMDRSLTPIQHLLCPQLPIRSVPP